MLMRLHRAPVPVPADEPFEEEFPGELPVPQDEPVPDHNPERLTAPCVALFPVRSGCAANTRRVLRPLVPG